MITSTRFLWKRIWIRISYIKGNVIDKNKCVSDSSSSFNKWNLFKTFEIWSKTNSDDVEKHAKSQRLNVCFDESSLYDVSSEKGIRGISATRVSPKDMRMHTMIGQNAILGLGVK